MRNFYKPIQDKKVVVVVDGKSVTFTNEKGQAVKFLASGEDFSIKYNTGALGGEYCVVDEGVCAYTEPNPKDFVNGNTYTAYYIAYFTERKCRRVNGTSDYYDEMYVELKTDDGYYSDILLHSTTIAVFVDGEEQPRPKRRIFAGYYKRYDGMPFYVVDVVRDLETKREVVICRHDDGKANGYFTLTMEAFCSKVDYNGKQIKKYFRDTKREKAGELTCEMLENDGYRTPIRKEKKEDKIRYRRTATTYTDYAKDLCTYYAIDLRTYELCQKTKKLVGVRNKDDYIALKEDLLFINSCLKTTLKEFCDYFKERFYEGKSLRKYAEEHGINRGSADYIQKKLIAALAENLEARDAADGKGRLSKNFGDEE